MMALYIWAALAASNFLVVVVTDRDWARALERSIFQGIAIFTYVGSIS